MAELAGRAAAAGFPCRAGCGSVLMTCGRCACRVKDSPSISTDGELPAADEEAIFKHYSLTYQASAVNGN